MVHAHSAEHAECLSDILPGFIGPIPPVQQARVRYIAAGELGPAAELLLDSDRVEDRSFCAVDIGRRQTGQRFGQRTVSQSVGESVTRVLRELDSLLA